jgi:CelD/BcsL family acetyltransferase involved in cellulose biosynthesis
VIEVSRAEQPLSAFRADWDRLLAVDHPGAPFRSFEWTSAWWNHLARGDDWLLVARRDGELVGLLPLEARRTLLGGLELGLTAGGIVGSDFVGVIARPDDAESCARAFAEWLTASSADRVRLDDLLANDPLVQALPYAQVTPRHRCLLVDTRGDFSAYLAARPSGVGAQWRRRDRFLMRQPGARLERLATPAEVARGLELLFALHRARWAEEGGSDAIDDARVEAFHREAAGALAARGWARIYLLEVSGAPRAALYGFAHAHRFAYYQAGYDPEWRARSVGTVLLGHVIRDCFTEGRAEFDFLRGDEAYKQAWATGERRTVRLELSTGGVRAALRRRVASLRARVKARLPESALHRLRRTRRVLKERLAW